MNETVHHAYLYTGNREASIPLVRTVIERELGTSLSQNPDLFWEETETFGIESARALREQAEKKALGEKKIFVLAFHFATREAQNALLKTLEEPTAETYFFIITRSAASLLPTLRSRLIQRKTTIPQTAGSARNTEASDFLASSVDERLKFVERFKDTDNEAKKSEFLELLTALEENLSRRTPRTRDIETGIREIFAFKPFIFDRSPSIKMIAEHLALTLPRIKKET